MNIRESIYQLIDDELNEFESEPTKNMEWMYLLYTSYKDLDRSAYQTTSEEVFHRLLRVAVVAVAWLEEWVRKSYG